MYFLRKFRISNVPRTTVANQSRQRFVCLCHRLQAERLIQARLLAELRGIRIRCGMPVINSDPPAFPLYRFVRNSGVLRMIPLPSVAGGAGVRSLSISTDALDEATVLRVEGDLDLATAPMLSNDLVEAYRTNVRVIVDLSRLEYLDCTGVRLLEQTANRHHGCFVVIGSKPIVRRVLEILNLIEVLPVKASLEAAKEYLRTPLTEADLIRNSKQLLGRA